MVHTGTIKSSSKQRKPSVVGSHLPWNFLRRGDFIEQLSPSEHVVPSISSSSICHARYVVSFFNFYLALNAVHEDREKRRNSMEKRKATKYEVSARLHCMCTRGTARVVRPVALAGTSSVPGNRERVRLETGHGKRARPKMTGQVQSTRPRKRQRRLYPTRVQLWYISNRYRQIYV